MAKKNNTDKPPKLNVDDASKMMRESLDVIESRFATIFTMLENQNILMGELADDTETLSALGMAGAKQAKKRRKVREREAAAAGAAAEQAAEEARSGNDVVDVSGLSLEEAAADLGALGHPVRLEIVQLCASEPRRVRDIAEILGHGTTGQIYHHLRQLMGAGWLTSASGNTYVVNEARTAALAAILGALR